MKDVNLTRIYIHLMRFYGVTRFRVFSILDEKGIYPKETKVEYFFDIKKNVNHVRLQRFLKVISKTYTSSFM